MIIQITPVQFLYFKLCFGMSSFTDSKNEVNVQYFKLVSYTTKPDTGHLFSHVSLVP